MSLFMQEPCADLFVNIPIIFLFAFVLNQLCAVSQISKLNSKAQQSAAKAFTSYWSVCIIMLVYAKCFWTKNSDFCHIIKYLKKILMGNHYKTICGPVRSECSSCRVQQPTFDCTRVWRMFVRKVEQSKFLSIFGRFSQLGNTCIKALFLPQSFADLNLVVRLVRKIYSMRVSLKPMILYYS